MDTFNLIPVAIVKSGKFIMASVIRIISSEKLLPLKSVCHPYTQAQIFAAAVEMGMIFSGRNCIFCRMCRSITSHRESLTSFGVKEDISWNS
jgi:hypothetical protein